MSLLGGHRPNHLSSQLLFLSGSVFIAITIIAAWIAIWDLRGERIADETKDTKNLAVVLAEQTARAIQAVDLVVQETQAMVLAAGVTDADQFRRRMGTEGVHHFLLDRLHSLPQANSIALLDDAGMIVNFSRAWPVPVIDGSDRDFYAYFREHNDPTPFIGVPVVNKFSGAWVIMVTRRISGPRGEFVGIVAGVVEARYFEDFYRAITTNGGEAASLFRRDGTLLARHPHLEGMIGTKISAESPWYASVANDGGTYRTPGYIGGVARIVSVQPVREYPLAVTLGISEDVALAPWRRQAIMIAISALGAVVGFGILFGALAAQFRRLEQSQTSLSARNVELERATQAVRDSEERFRQLYEASSDWFWETDADHRRTYLSPNFEQITGLKAADYLGKRREQYGDTSIQPDEWREHIATIAARRPFRDFVFRDRQAERDRKIIWAKVSGVPVFAPDGTFRGYRGTGSIVTAQVEAEERRRELEAQLMHSQKLEALGTLAGGVAHDLNNTLVPILALSKLALDELPVGSGIRSDIETIIRASERARDLVKQILTFSRKQNLVKQKVDLAAVAREALQMLRASLPATIRIVEQIREVPPLFGDAGELHQVVVNLMTNAAQAIGAGVGSITVSLWRASEIGGFGPMVRLSVADTGCGMDETTRNRVFEPFFTTKEVGSGTGLGLSVVHGIVIGHGGKITVCSKLGEGTQFIISLPCGEQHQTISRAEPAAA
jgi:PAS domain S-box-containing protein